ncbi:AI-2E family transporter [Cellulomonas wangsupingiae]|uniref:AI-2E family transporter n=1 Tax=Cellulomonas wangsupingiae TaxID=2968085 RepID=A0ABY5K8R5_9CELL|nr:AI-2E family transporter [Cellulomonas wangsupingiae]MCC2334494.1 AI-2E family transporter [Cellulomonas wangsupingiae]MCM0640135.1 AI-2E family transporter [Cellulomonas wangsupingiae]UUI66153.1 AI-2E family transporter [Cellulomonas wangsupingiae]
MGLFGRRHSPLRVEAPPSPPPAPAPTGTLWSDGLGRVGTRSVQVLAVLAVAAVVVFALTRLTLVVIPVLIALVLAAAISPLVGAMRRRGVPSMLATWIALLALVALLAGVVWLVVRAVADQWDELSEQALDGFDELQTLVQGLPFNITAEQLDSVRESALGLLQSDAVGSGAVAGVSQTADFVAGFFIMVVVLFFFLKDGPKIWEFLLRPFEGERYERGRRVGDATVRTLGGYVRGTAIIAAVDAVGIGIGLALVGVPLVLPLSVLVFLLAFIPLVGATLAGILAALVALVAVGPVQALVVVGIVVLVNQLEGDFLQPVVMGRSLRLHPLVILFALTAGTVLAGVTGAVLAVPIAASVWRSIQVWDGPDLPARFARKKRAETV